MARWRVDLVGLLEALYCIEQSREEWAVAVMNTLRVGLGPTAGIGALFYDVSDPVDLRIDGMLGHNISPGWIAAGQQQHRDAAMRAAQRASYRSLLCATSKELAAKGWPEAAQRIETDMADHGLKETVMINGANPEASGCALFIFSKDELRLTGTVRRDLTRIAIHLAASYRLLGRMSRTSSAAAPVDAVLRPDGKFEHVEPAAESRQDRAGLSEATKIMTWARSDAGREHPEKAIALWKGLVSGRWTLVESFERDGKKYVLARQNAPVTSCLSNLSARERQVAALASLRRSNKVIAYELGLAHSTVRVLLARAAAKLGVGSREELVTALSNR